MERAEVKEIQGVEVPFEMPRDTRYEMGIGNGNGNGGG